jgi:hypothetical protein
METSTPHKANPARKLFSLSPTPRTTPTTSPTTPHMISELTESLNHLNVTPAVSRSHNFLSPTKASKARHEALLKAGRKNAGVGNALIRAGTVLKNDIEEKTLLTNGTRRAESAADGILQTVR